MSPSSMSGRGSSGVKTPFAKLALIVFAIFGLLPMGWRYYSRGEIYEIVSVPLFDAD